MFVVKELMVFINNFSEVSIFGIGGYGMVYKGVFFDNKVVMIKKFKIVDEF